jgi:hypothetical protein
VLHVSLLAVIIHLINACAHTLKNEKVA